MSQEVQDLDERKSLYHTSNKRMTGCMGVLWETLRGFSHDGSICKDSLRVVVSGLKVSGGGNLT